MKPYTSKSLQSAIREVRACRRMIERYEEICNNQDKQIKALAKLSAEGPTFLNPLDAMNAKAVRDGILREMEMNRRTP